HLDLGARLLDLPRCNRLHVSTVADRALQSLGLDELLATTQYTLPAAAVRSVDYVAAVQGVLELTLPVVAHHG
ncbi:hypothetical protein ACXWOJ_09725, partial [Streptococcus pyogenes]